MWSFLPHAWPFWCYIIVTIRHWGLRAHFNRPLLQFCHFTQLWIYFRTNVRWWPHRSRLLSQQLLKVNFFFLSLKVLLDTISVINSDYKWYRLKLSSSLLSDSHALNIRLCESAFPQRLCKSQPPVYVWKIISAASLDIKTPKSTKVPICVFKRWNLSKCHALQSLFCAHCWSWWL